MIIATHMFSSKNQKTSRLSGAAVPPLRPCATTETCYPKPDVVAWRYPWGCWTMLCPMGDINGHGLVSKLFTDFWWPTFFGSIVLYKSPKNGPTNLPFFHPFPNIGVEPRSTSTAGHRISRSASRQRVMDCRTKVYCRLWGCDKPRRSARDSPWIHGKRHRN